MSSFLCSVVRLTRKSCLCVHAASPPQRGFEAVLTRQWFEWCVCVLPISNNSDFLVACCLSIPTVSGIKVQSGLLANSSWIWASLMERSLCSGTEVELLWLQTSGQPHEQREPWRSVASVFQCDESPSDASAESSAFKDESRAQFNCCWRRSILWSSSEVPEALFETSLRFPHTANLCVLI